MGDAQAKARHSDGALVPVPITFSKTALENVAKLGITPSAMPPEHVFVRRVDEGSWAEQCGIRAGDELTCVDDHPVSRMSRTELTAAMQSTRPIKLTFLRIANKASEEAAVFSSGTMHCQSRNRLRTD